MSVVLTVTYAAVIENLFASQPELSDAGVEQFYANAVGGDKPYLEFNVHVDLSTDEWVQKKKILAAFLPDDGIFSCKMTTRNDELTRACLGFLRFAVVEYENLRMADSMHTLPAVKSLDQLIPLWLENERDVSLFLKKYFSDLVVKFEGDEAQLQILLEEEKQGTNPNADVIAKLEAQLRAHVMVRYWNKAADVLIEIAARFDKLHNVEEFKTDEGLVQYLAQQVAPLKESSDPEFKGMIVEFFVKGEGFRTMIKEELEFLDEMADEIAIILAQEAEEKEEAARAEKTKDEL